MNLIGRFFLLVHREVTQVSIRNLGMVSTLKVSQLFFVISSTESLSVFFVISSTESF